MAPNYALAEQVSFNDPDIVPEYITYPSPNGHGDVRGCMVRPAGAEGKLPAVVVVHENRGLSPYIEDVARRLAKAGFMAIAPDGLSSVGGYPGNDAEGRELQRTVDSTKLMNDFFAAVEFMKNQLEMLGSRAFAMVVVLRTPQRLHIQNSRCQFHTTAVKLPPKMSPKSKPHCCCIMVSWTSA